MHEFAGPLSEDIILDFFEMQGVFGSTNRIRRPHIGVNDNVADIRHIWFIIKR